MSAGFGSYIVIDGITGSGKSTIMEEMRRWTEACGHTIFDFEAWCKEEGRIPHFEELPEMDVIFACEPTKAWIGEAIRGELSHDEGYSAHELAHAFSLDRHILQRRLILPARNAGKLIIQSRSVSSSLAIQPMMENGPTMEELLDLPGNAFCLDHAPDHLILTHVPPEIVQERLKARDYENKGVFEELDLLKKEEEAYKSKEFAEIFTSRGTKVHQFNANLPLEEVQKNARQLIDSILTHK